MHRIVRPAAVLVTLLSLFTTGCGKKGALIYPEQLVATAPSGITVDQQDASFFLSFNLPERDRSGRKLDDLEAILVSRQALPDSSCSSCQEQFSHLARVELAFPAPARIAGNRVILTDSDLKKGELYRYRLQPVQKGGVAGDYATSRGVSLKPVPEAPLLKVSSHFGGILMVELGSDLAKQPGFAGYRVYRRTMLPEGSDYELLATVTEGDRYQDQAAQAGIKYGYRATVVIKYPDGVSVEGVRSAETVAELAGDH